LSNSAVKDTVTDVQHTNYNRRQTAREWAYI